MSQSNQSRSFHCGSSGELRPGPDRGTGQRSRNQSGGHSRHGRETFHLKDQQPWRPGAAGDVRLPGRSSGLRLRRRGGQWVSFLPLSFKRQVRFESGLSLFLRRRWRSPPRLRRMMSALSIPSAVRERLSHGSRLTWAEVSRCHPVSSSQRSRGAVAPAVERMFVSDRHDRQRSEALQEPAGAPSVLFFQQKMQRRAEESAGPADDIRHHQTRLETHSGPQ